MANPTRTPVSNEADPTAEVQGYITPIPIPLPNPDATTSLPQPVRSFSRSLGTIAVPHLVPLPGVVDPPNPLAEVQGYTYAPGTASTTLPFNPFGPRPSGFPPCVRMRPQ